MPVILATDLIVYALFAAIAYFVFAARKGAEASAVWRHIKKDKLALISLVILSLYGLVALSDSIRWRDALKTPPASTAKDAPAPAVKTIYSPQPLSVLDRTLSGLKNDTEKTFSAPLADKLYVKETIETPDGAHVREHPALKHPGSHLLGTDKVGRDVFFSALKGVRTGVVIGAGATLLMVPFALLFGVLAGYYGGRTDDAVQYVYTTLSSIPGVLLIVAFMLIFGTKGYQGGLVTDAYLKWGFFVPSDRLFWLCVIMGITSWTDLCRLIRGETLKLRELEYVQASRAFAASDAFILMRHITPNVMHLVLITFVLHFSGLVLSEAVLSYLGIGVGPETGSWGNMVNNARLELSREPVVWWSLLGAFVFMFGLVLPANILADAVRDALDPKLRMGRK